MLKGWSSRRGTGATVGSAGRSATRMTRPQLALLLGGAARGQGRSVGRQPISVCLPQRKMVVAYLPAPPSLAAGGFLPGAGGWCVRRGVKGPGWLPIVDRSVPPESPTSITPALPPSPLPPPFTLPHLLRMADGREGAGGWEEGRVLSIQSHVVAGWVGNKVRFTPHSRRPRPPTPPPHGTAPSRGEEEAIETYTLIFLAATICLNPGPTRRSPRTRCSCTASMCAPSIACTLAIIRATPPGSEARR